MTRFRRSMVGALITGLAHLITSLPAGAVWDHAHGDSANTGFARVDTAPALKPQQTVQVGTLAPGAGPVVGPNGTVYVANMTGKVLAFHPDGTPAWNRILHIADPYLASPVVGADGAVYAVSVRKEHDRDRTGHLNQVYTRYESTLRKFTGDGGVLWSVRLPAVPKDPPPSPSLAGWPLASTAPSIWRSGTRGRRDAGSVQLPELSGASLDGLLDRVGSCPRQHRREPQDGRDHGHRTGVERLGSAVLRAPLLGFLVVPPLPSPVSFTTRTARVQCPCLSDIGWPMPALAIAPDRRGALFALLDEDTGGHLSSGLLARAFRRS